MLLLLLLFAVAAFTIVVFITVFIIIFAVVNVVVSVVVVVVVVSDYNIIVDGDEIDVYAHF